MSLIAKAESNTSFTPVPPGMHLARCFRIVDLGTQKSVYKGVEKHLRKILIQFEIHSEDSQGNPLLTDKGEPLSISKRYTLSLSEKATLSLDLESWRGAAFTADERKGFDLKKLLGVWAMLNITKSVGADGKEYTNIETINPVPMQIKKAGLPEAHNETMLYSIDNSDNGEFEKLSENVKKTIMSSPEWQHKSSRGSSQVYDDGFGDDPNEPF
jgi:hypothetical protein